MSHMIACLTSVPIGLSSGTEKWRTNHIGAMIGTHKRGRWGSEAILSGGSGIMNFVTKLHHFVCINLPQALNLPQSVLDSRYNKM